MTDNSVVIRKFSNTGKGVQSDLQIRPEINDAQDFIREYRQAAWDTYKSTPLPTGMEEDWRRTSLSSVRFSDFMQVTGQDDNNIQLPQRLSDPVMGQEKSGHVFLTPLQSKVNLNDELRCKGVIFDSLKDLIKTNPELVARVLSRIDPKKSGKFGALAASLNINGVLLYIPANVKLDAPLQSTFWAQGEGLVFSQHVLVYLEDNASAVYVHESSSPEKAEKDSLHAGIIEIYVGRNSHLDFVELQSWGENIINMTRENVVIDQDGSVDWIFGALGSRLTKNNSTLNLVGKGSTGKMSGFYFTDNSQHLDHDTQQNHLAPATTSDLLFKGALLDHSRSVWQGMIYVAPEAHGTDGYQANRNLVLSRQARADSIPGLEILTDDVRCTHGATVGKIDEEQVFYLESRGMTREIAERLIVEGFFDPIMQRIPFEGVRNRFQKAIKEKMEHIG